MRILGYDIGVVEALIIVNILVFIVTITNPFWVLDNFALLPVKILEQPWTIITSMFVHYEFSHIFRNVLWLFVFGITLRMLIGECDLLKVYFVGGILASLVHLLTSLLFNIPPPNIQVVGASSAILAITATLAMLKPKMTRVFNLILWIARVFVVFSLISLSFIPGIAYGARLGGLPTGLVFGAYFRMREHSRS